MSWDFAAVDPISRNVLQVEHHELRGGTYAEGGTTAAELNVTYNYGHDLRQAIGGSPRDLDGLPIVETLPALEQGLLRLRQEHGEPGEVTNYWDATPHNAMHALQDIITLGRMAVAKCRSAVWHVD